MIMASLRRALLYVPSSSSRMLLRSRQVEVDSLIYDLEDSVPAGKKLEARSNVLEILQSPRETKSEQLVRVNSPKTEYGLDDLLAVLPTSNIDGIILPKVDNTSDLDFVQMLLQNIGPKNGDGSPKSRSILACIESAAAVTNLRAICDVGTRYGILGGLIFSAEDYAAAVGVKRTPSLLEMIYARQKVVTYAKAYNLSAIDLVCTALRSNAPSSASPEDMDEVLRAECRQGREFGFTGKQAIHPTQVSIVQEVYGVDPERLKWAQRVIEKSKEEAAAGAGAFVLDGKVIDEPVMKEAKRIIEESEREKL